MITRAGSTARFPEGVAAVHRGSCDDAAFLATAFAGQRVLIMALSYEAYGAQTPLIDAAAAAAGRCVGTAVRVRVGREPLGTERRARRARL